jgi:hypothetical protein
MNNASKQRSKSVSSILEELCIYLHLYQSSLPDIRDLPTLEEAEDDLIDQAEDFISKICDESDDNREPLLLYASAILKGWRMAMEKHINYANKCKDSSTTENNDIDNIKNWIKSLQEHTSVAQRTEDWYIQGSKLLTGSEIYTLFGSPYQRGQLVLSKANPQPRYQNKLVVRTQWMTPFDWGIRFEPVVAQIYEHITKCKISELGRIVGTRDSRIAASPDGIVIEGDRIGRLVEMKAPVSRIINNTIPPEYYAQMQTQMEVTGAKACDYIEVKFNAPYKIECGPLGPREVSMPILPKFYGIIYIMAEDDTDRDPDDMFYEPKLSYYYPSLFEINGANLGGYRRDQIVESIYWSCTHYSLQTVYKSDEWWVDMQRRIDEFWKDVDLACEGKFEAPPTTRQIKNKVDPQNQTLNAFMTEIN